MMCSTTPASACAKLLRYTRAIRVSPSSALSVTFSAGLYTTDPLPGCALTPMAAPGGLGQLTVALGFALRRKPLGDRGHLHIGFCPYVLGHLRGDPNQVG